MKKKTFWGIIAGCFAVLVVLLVCVGARLDLYKTDVKTEVIKDVPTISIADAITKMENRGKIDSFQYNVGYSASKSDYLFADKNVVLNSIINHNVLLLGSDVKIDSDYVSGIVLGAGLNINSDSRIDYGLLLGQVVNVNGQVDKDIASLAQIVNIDKDAVIGRDAVFAAETVNLSGTIYGNVSIAAANINFDNAQILGDVSLAAANIKFDNTSNIYGTLNYASDAEVTNLDDSRINRIVKTTVVTPNVDNITKALGLLLGVIMTFLVSALTTAFAYYVAPKYMADTADNNDFGSNFGWGLLALIGIPVASIFIMLVPGLTVIGSLCLGGYGLLLTASIAPTTVMLGRFIRGFIGKRKADKYSDNFVGSIFNAILVVCPIITAIVAVSAFGFEVRSIKRNIMAKNALTKKNK